MAVAYDEDYYIGKVLKIQEDFVQVNFLKRKESGYYTWLKKDMGNVKVEYIFAAKVRFLGKKKDERGVGPRYYG